MLKKLTLTCFRRHENLAVDFTSGLNLIRAPNEGGKSTIAEAIAYALFGAKALRTTFAETVTWGYQPNELKVVLHIGDFVFTRSSRGAEVTRNGDVHVTGQNEVSTFAASLIGADAAAASKLMMANQGNLRGSLEAGPAATAQMIEQMADFDLFDRLIERMQSDLMLGNPALLEESLKQAESHLAGFVGVTRPEKVEYDAKEADYRKKIEDATGRLIEAKAVGTKLKAEAVKLQEQAREIVQAYFDLEKAQKNLGDNTSAHDAAVRNAALGPKPEEIDAAVKAVADAEKWEAAKQAWSWLKSWKPSDVYEGTREAMEAASKELEKVVRSGREQIAVAKKDIALHERTLNEGDTCSACGQRLPNAEAVAERKVRAEAEIATLRRRIEVLETSLNLNEGELDSIKRTYASNSELHAALDLHREFINLDHETFPPTPSWKGEPPTGGDPDLKGIKARLNSLTEAREAAQMAAGRAEALAEVVSRAQDEVSRLEARIAALPAIDQAAVDAAQHRADVAQLQIDAIDVELSTVKTMLDLSIRAYQEAFEIWERSEKERAGLACDVTMARANLDKLHFNNALLKKIRSARPLVADKLWNTVLAAVSTMFSSMRGERSIVAKDGSGFTVNGQAVASLSGSTLDILGMAIRVALTRTFLPACPFLILDEPFSACDDNRAAAMLAFIQESGFEQTLLVTHEELSNTLSNNTIAL